MKKVLQNIGMGLVVIISLAAVGYFAVTELIPALLAGLAH